MSLLFEVIYQSKKSAARVGKIITPHGEILTPAFVPVATHAALKAVPASWARELGIQLMFCNTYHLMLQPGEEVVSQAGGLHQFMRHSGPLITDSGGFQVFSLLYGGVSQELKSQGAKKNSATLVSITEEGALFRSYRDGAKILLTPERSIQAQKKLGADIIVAFDELPPYHMSYHEVKKAMERTHRWEERSIIEHLKNKASQSMYAVVHGGISKELRAQSAQFLSKLPFDGFAIGGSVGKDRKEMIDMLYHLMPHLPETSPRHLLGIADMASLEHTIPLGIDTFDSCYPTRVARHGIVLTTKGPLKITTTAAAMRHEPIEKECQCPTCAEYTIAYLCHLYKSHELAFYTLTTVHNVYAMNKYMEKWREAILAGEK